MMRECAKFRQLRPPSGPGESSRHGPCEGRGYDKENQEDEQSKRRHQQKSPVCAGELDKSLNSRIRTPGSAFLNGVHKLLAEFAGLCWKAGQEKHQKKTKAEQAGERSQPHSLRGGNRTWMATAVDGDGH